MHLYDEYDSASINYLKKKSIFSIFFIYVIKLYIFITQILFIYLFK